jgi:hypothetical protein
MMAEKSEAGSKPLRAQRSKVRPFRNVQIIAEADLKGLMPLDYMLAVMRDPTATQTRRDRMAALAAPYCHPKLTDTQPKGRKEQRAEAAERAGIGTPWAEDLDIDGTAPHAYS